MLVSHAHRSPRLVKHMRFVYASVLLDGVDVLDYPFGAVVAGRGPDT